ncbi:MAG: ATP phosphoribosyltransferase [bacterium]|nr:MAG: ATP phosphoribosyltransferase [bacterium]
MDRNAITVALPKGRLLPDCIRLLSAVGMRTTEEIDTSRKLLFSSEDGSARILVVRDKDLPTYVEYGAADVGVVGKDVLMESGADLLEPADLGFGFCRIVVARPASISGREDPTGWGHMRVATKYPRITTDHFASRGEQVEIIPLYGSIELAPLVGLADRIVDLVSSGETLRQNNLAEVEEVARITARLVVNRASMKIKSDRLAPLIQAIRQETEREQRGVNQTRTGR